LPSHQACLFVYKVCDSYSQHCLKFQSFGKFKEKLHPYILLSLKSDWFDSNDNQVSWISQSSQFHWTVKRVDDDKDGGADDKNISSNHCYWGLDSLHQRI
jgi:hypothetical protein